jgi:hypothetical protein
MHARVAAGAAALAHGAQASAPGHQPFTEPFQGLIRHPTANAKANAAYSEWAPPLKPVRMGESAESALSPFPYLDSTPPQAVKDLETRVRDAAKKPGTQAVKELETRVRTLAETPLEYHEEGGGGFLGAGMAAAAAGVAASAATAYSAVAAYIAPARQDTHRTKAAVKTWMAHRDDFDGEKEEITGLTAARLEAIQTPEIHTTVEERMKLALEMFPSLMYRLESLAHPPH